MESTYSQAKPPERLLRGFPFGGLLAVYDITEIADYIEAQFGIARADRFQEEIKERLDKLEISGSMFEKAVLRVKKERIESLAKKKPCKY